MSTGNAAVSPGPIRRSALDALHARLGARWVSGTAHWPANYGDSTREAGSARAAAGLVDVGPVAKAGVRGPGAGPLLSGEGLQLRPGRVDGEPGSDSAQVWGMAPDEAVVLGDRATELVQRASDGVAVVDLTSALALFRLVGPNAIEVVRSVCGLDVHPSAFAERPLSHAAVANVRCTIARLDWAGHPAFAVLLQRDYAQYVWETLLHVGRVEGLVAIGATALKAGDR